MRFLLHTRPGNAIAICLVALIVNGAMCGGMGGAADGFTKHESKTRLQNNGLQGPQGGSFDLGKAVYDCLLRDLQASNGPCKAQRIASLQSRRDDLIRAVNTIFAAEIRGGLVNTLNHLLVLIDTGVVPRMIDDVAGVLNLLKTDVETLDAIVQLSNATKQGGLGALDQRDVMKLVSRFLNFPEVEQLVYTLAHLLNNDSSGLVDSGLEFVSNSLKDMKTATAKTEEGEEPEDGLRTERIDLCAELLKAVEVVGDDRMGQPVWIPVLDPRGKPQAGLDAGGKPVSPFVDADQDGKADRNADGELVDGSGKAVTTPVLDGNGNRQTNAAGQFLYVYVDAKRTVLSMLVQLVGDAAEKGLHRELATLFEHAAGNRVPYDNGTVDPSDDYMGFAKDSAIVELNHGTLELLKYGQLPKLLETLSVLFERKEALAEELLVKIGKVIEIGRDFESKRGTTPNSASPTTSEVRPPAPAAPATGSTGSGSTTGILETLAGALGGATGTGSAGASTGTGSTGTGSTGTGSTGTGTGAASDDKMLDDLLLMADELFRVNAGGMSTARLLMQVIHDLGQTAREVPAELALMTEYNHMVRGDDGDGDRILQSQSIRVDWAKPAVYTDESGNVVDNRSLLHRLANMIAATDACTLPIINKSIAELHLGLLADMTPDTADSLHQVFVQLTGVNPALADILCPGMSRDIVALDSLATAGVLDALIPIVKAFKDRGQLRVFIEIMKLQDAHYDSIREGEEKLMHVLRSGVVEKVFDVVAVMTEIEVPGSQTEKLADVFADFARHLVDRSNPNLFRFDGTQVSTLAHLVLGPMDDLDALLAGTPGEKARENLMTGVLDCVVKTESFDNDTPDFAGDDYELLENRFIIPFLSKALRFTVDKLGTDTEKRIENVTKLQQDFADQIASRRTVNLIDLLIVFRDTPGSDAFDRAIVNVLRANADPSRDVYAVVIKLVSMGLQTKIEADDAAKQLAWFAGTVLEPNRGLIRNAINGFSEIFRRDEGKVILQLVRNAVWMGPDGNSKTPAEVILDVVSAISPKACEDGRLTRETLIQKIDEILEFLTGSQLSGLQQIFKIVRERKR